MIRKILRDIAGSGSGLDHYVSRAMSKHRYGGPNADEIRRDYQDIARNVSKLGGGF